MNHPNRNWRARTRAAAVEYGREWARTYGIPDTREGLAALLEMAYRDGAQAEHVRMTERSRVAD